MPSQRFVYRARVTRVVDGDTLDLEIDQGMNSRRIERVRLLGINTPEVRGPSREAGLAATEFVRAWCQLKQMEAGPESWPLVIQTEKADAFGRYLAHVWSAKSGEYLNKAILEAGHALPYEE